MIEKFLIHELLRHYCEKGISARAAAAEICEMEGEGKVSKTTELEWFKCSTTGRPAF